MQRKRLLLVKQGFPFDFVFSLSAREVNEVISMLSAPKAP